MNNISFRAKNENITKAAIGVALAHGWALNIENDRWNTTIGDLARSACSCGNLTIYRDERRGKFGYGYHDAPVHLESLDALAAELAKPTKGKKSIGTIGLLGTTGVPATEQVTLYPDGSITVGCRRVNKADMERVIAEYTAYNKEQV